MNTRKDPAMATTPETFVDALNSAFGKQTTQRAAHAKGVVLFGKVRSERGGGEREQGVRSFPEARSGQAPRGAVYRALAGAPSFPVVLKKFPVLANFFPVI